MSSGISAAAARPVVPPFAVDRPQLVDRLDDALQRRVVFLVAPAGYGKSVLLAQWAAARPGRRVAWVSARGVGQDAIAFARRLRSGLAALAGDLGHAQDQLPGTVDQLGPVFLERVLDELGRGPELVLVIEDFEGLAAPGVLVEIGQLAE